MNGVLVFLPQLVVMIGIRKLLDLFFTQRELKILDDVMPEPSKRSAEEKKRKLEEDDDEETGDVSDELHVGLCSVLWHRFTYDIILLTFCMISDLIKLSIIEEVRAY